MIRICQQSIIVFFCKVEQIRTQALRLRMDFSSSGMNVLFTKLLYFKAKLTIISLLGCPMKVIISWESSTYLDSIPACQQQMLKFLLQDRWTYMRTCTFEVLLSRVKNRVRYYTAYNLWVMFFNSSLSFCPLLGPALHCLHQESSSPGSPGSCVSRCMLGMGLAKRQWCSISWNASCGKGFNGIPVV